MSMFFKPDLYDILCILYSEERMLENIQTLKKLEGRGYSCFDKSTQWCKKVLEEACLFTHFAHLIERGCKKSPERKKAIEVLIFGSS